MTQQERMLELLSGIVSYVNFNCHGKICLLRLTYFYGEKMAACALATFTIITMIG